MASRTHPARRGVLPPTAAAGLAAVALLAAVSAAATATPAGRTLTVDEAWAITAGGPGDNPYGNGKCCVPYEPCLRQACTGTANCEQVVDRLPINGGGSVCVTPTVAPGNDDPNCIVSDAEHACSTVTQCTLNAAGTLCVIGSTTFPSPMAPDLCADNCDPPKNPGVPPE